MGVWDKCNPEAISINTNSNEDDEMAVINDPNPEAEAEGGDDFQSKVLSILDSLVSRMDALESAESAEVAAPEAAPVVEAEAAPEPVAEAAAPKPEDDAENTLAEHANRIAALEGAGVKDDSEAEQEAEIMDDSMVIAGMLGTKVVKPYAGEKASSLRKRTLKQHVVRLIRFEGRR